jgi:hypothetical protein
MAGKGDTPRPGVHGKAWDDCPLWKKATAKQSKRETKKCQTKRSQLK